MEINRRKSKFKTKDMVETALLTALVFVATAFINIRLPMLATGGLVHLGTVMLFVTAIVFGKEKGAIAAAVGMAIFDLSSGWALWAPFTFIVRGIMGYMVGAIAWSRNEEGNSIVLNLLAIVLSGIWMIAGYYITEGILYGNWASPVASIPGNVTQIVIGLLLGLPIAKVLRRYKKYI
ncbi:ECF transporter S component [Clostridium diolis]|uniref:ECF transporter S component n=1 Tax=Clostridium diolis TaxID=223919 RepID=UPI000B3FAC9C|nr:ECF transporter S component [Clostridium diolis]OVE65294.1 ECF transporter S component [Clostridium diolis]